MKEIGNNLKRIRLLQNLSLEKAGKLVGMSAPAVAKYEAGIITPDSDKLIKFADAYNVKVLDILKIYNAPRMKFTAFRKKQSLKGQNLELLKEIIQNKVSDYLEAIELNSSSIKENIIKPIQCRNMQDAEMAAEEFRKRNELSINQPISNLINVLENLGILIIQIDDINGKFSKFDGLSEIVNGIPIIVLLKYENGARQRFTIAHELGHLVLNINSNCENVEKLCDRFAGALLMPKDAVINEFGITRNKISFYELKAFKAEYKTSLYAIIYRLKELKIISEYSFKNFNISFNRLGFKKDEPVQIAFEESCQFKKLIHKLETDNIISLNKACELLGISINEYNSQDNNYGY